jgi:hypothetical protein
MYARVDKGNLISGGKSGLFTCVDFDLSVSSLQSTNGKDAPCADLGRERSTNSLSA